MEDDDFKMFSQADVNKLIAKRVNEVKAQYADYDALKAENTKLKADLDAEKVKSTEAQKAQQKAGIEAIKAKVAKELGLPEKWLPMVNGEDEATVRANAKQIVDALGPAPAVGSGTNPPNEGPKTFTREQVQKMNPQQILENWPVIEKQLADGSLRQVS